MKAAEDTLVTFGAAIAVASLAGLLLHLAGATLGPAIVDAATLGVAVFICGKMVAGSWALVKVSGALAAFMAAYSAMGYAATAMIDGRGDWHSGSWVFPGVFLAAMLLLSPSVLSRLRLRRRPTGDPASAA